MKKLPVVFLIFVIIGGIFLFSQIVKSDNTNVVINEIGAYEPDNHEWVEIFNYGSENINLEGWRFLVEGESAHGINLSSSSDSFILGAGEYGIIAENADNFKIDYPMCLAKIYDTANFTLNESGSKKIGLRDNNDIDLEYFNYPEAKDYSLERVGVLVSALDANNWKEHPASNTAGSINYWTTYVAPEPGPTSTPSTTNQLPIVVIDGPTSTLIGANVEFDGSDSSDPDGTIDGYEWSVDSEMVGASSSLGYIFNNVGDYDIGLLVIDNLGATSSASLNVVVNSITTSSTTPTSTSPTPTTTGIYINEFLPDPAISGDHEWVELYNTNTSSIDLTGWVLSDSVAVRYSPTGTIPAGGFFVIELSNTLNNTGDTLALKNSLGTVIDQVVYGNSSLPAPGKGNSLARRINGTGSFAETTNLTKGADNIITAPIVNNSNNSGGGGGQGVVSNPVIQFDSSTTKIIINELLPNPKGSDTQGEYLEIKNLSANQIDLKDWVLTNSAGTKFKIKDGVILANGFLLLKRSTSNISLKNTGEEIVKLMNPAGTTVDQVKYLGSVEEDTSYSRKADNTWEWTAKMTPNAENIFLTKNLPPQVVVEFKSEILTGETAVFDASDSVDPEGGILSFIWSTGDEEKTGEIVNFVFDRAGKRVINLKVVDDNKNIVEKKLQVTVVRDESESGSSSTSSTTSQKTTTFAKSSKALHAVILSLDKIKNSNIGDIARVKGQVAVLPGILGTQYFYIIDETSGAGVQIYSFKKDFPVLAVGDEIAVNGEVSESRGEKRIKTKTKADIKKISTGKNLEPQKLVISDLDEDSVGALVQVQGEVTEVKGTNIYLDDGSNEIKVYFKSGAGIDSKMFKLGEMWQATGLVALDKDGVQLLPRVADDLEKISEATSTMSVDDNSTNSTTQTYLTATAGGLTSILLSLLAKARGKVAFSLIKKVGSVAINVIRRGPPKV